MSWSAPVTQVTGYVVVASDWNVQVNDLLYLYGDTSWTTVSVFSGTWSAAATCRYIRHGNVVYLNGAVTGGTINTAAFTLPAGYRPSASFRFATESNTGATLGYLQIGTTGVCTPVAGSTTSFAIDCSFSAI